jgi:exoribonuclease-2
MKPGTRVSLQVQEVDTLLMELRSKFIAVLTDEPLSTDILAIEEGDIFIEEVSPTDDAKLDESKVDAAIAENQNQTAIS